MRHNKLNHNRGIMMGIMAMALVVLTVTIIFWMWCFPTVKAEPEAPMAGCTVTMGAGFSADSVQVHWNDSLLFAGKVGAGGARFGAPVGEALLMVADMVTDSVFSFEVQAETRRIDLQKQAGQIQIRQLQD